VNTGEVFVNPPTEPGQRLVTGDTVNVAYRLQEVARGGQVVLGSSTYQLVRDRVKVGPAEQIQIRGKSSLVNAYRLAGLLPEVPFVRSTPTLVGRERELRRLEAAFDDAVADSSCELFTIIGSAGVGKSRLAAELERLLRSHATFVRGRCLSYGQGITYWPIGEIVRSALGIAPDAAQEAVHGQLDDFLAGAPDGPEIASRVAQVIGLEPGTYPREELYWSVRRLLEVRSADRPLVAIVDDIHWAEPSLLDLLEYIAETGRNYALFLLCITRPDLLEHRPGWGGGKHNATSLVLEPFGTDRANELLTSLAGSPLPPDVATRITVGAEGNPLFIEELFRMLVDRGTLRRGAQGWIEDESLDPGAVPSTIQALLAARLDQLAPSERIVAQTAAVVGRSFEATEVASLLDEPSSASLTDDIRALVTKEILRVEDETGPVNARFRFRHDLIRDAAYESLWKLDRAVLHERLADRLETAMVERAAEYDAIIGHHLDQALRCRTELGLQGPEVDALARRAGRWLARAGHAANLRHDVAASAGLLSRAIDLLQEDDLARVEAVIDYGDVAGSQGDYTEAGSLLSDAVVLTRDRDPDLSRRARLYYLYWRRAALGAPAPTVPEVEELIDELIAAGDDKTVSEALIFLAGDLYADRGQLAKARALVRTAQMYAERSGDRDASTECLAELVHLGVRDLTPCIEVMRDCRQLLATPGLSLAVRAMTLEALAVLLGMRGEFDEARAALQEAKRIDADLGNARRARYRSLALGLIEQFHGDAVRAESAFRDAYESASEIKAASLPFLAARLALPTLLLGRDDEAWALVGEAQADREPWSAILWRGVQARILARRGRLAEAVDLAQAMLADGRADGFEEVPNVFAAALENAAAVMRDAGRPEDGRRLLEDAISRYEAKENIAAARLARESLSAIAGTRS
jgi:tetratricopeptide (TPR) repeat protein